MQLRRYNSGEISAWNFDHFEKGTVEQKNGDICRDTVPISIEVFKLHCHQATT